MKYTLVVLFAIFCLVESGCVLKNPDPWNSPNPIEIVACNTNYMIQWNDTNPKGLGLQGNLYETISGNFVTTLLDNTLTNLNESMTVKFSCSLRDDLHYQMILLETPFSPTRYDCRSKSIKITKCGNGVLDPLEECEYTFEPGCGQGCLCHQNHTRVDDQCCPKSAACNFNKNLTITEISDFSDLKITINGRLVIQKNVTLNLKTDLTAMCIDNRNAFLVINATKAQVGDKIQIKTNCTEFIKDRVDVVGKGLCLQTNITYVNSIFSMEFEKIEGCAVKQIVKKYAGLIAGLILAGVVVVIIILTTFKRFRRNVFSGRDGGAGKDEDDNLDGDQIEKDILGNNMEDGEDGVCGVVEEDIENPKDGVKVEIDGVEEVGEVVKVEEEVEVEVEEGDNEIVI